MTAAALIVAAGSSVRLGTGQKKEYMSLSGKPVLHHVYDAFARCNSIEMIFLVVPPGGISRARDLMAPVITGIYAKFIEGGATRQQSVFNGLQALETAAPDYVLIHDGARPWITKSCIDRVLNGAVQTGAAAPRVSPADAIKVIGADGTITEHMSRENTVGIQTPQGFSYPEILKAHRAAAQDGSDYIDDTEIYCRYIHPVQTVPGDVQNRKITYLHDFETAARQ